MTVPICMSPDADQQPPRHEVVQAQEPPQVTVPTLALFPPHSESHAP